MLLSHMPKNNYRKNIGRLMRSSRRYGQNCMSVAQRLCESYCVVENEYHGMYYVYSRHGNVLSEKNTPPPTTRNFLNRLITT